MAKKRTATKPQATPKRPEPKPPAPPAEQILEPKAVHELLGLPGPYDPPEPPVTTKSYASWWDPGLSINELRRRRKDLFPYADWMDGQTFAKASDSWRWRLIDLTPLGVGQ